jgi:hypothetical protein
MAGSLTDMFKFKGQHGQNKTLFLDPITGQPF